MKKIIYLLCVVCQLSLFARDCDLPLPYGTVNTGSNLTLMMTESFIGSLATVSENPYIVALTVGGVVVGSSSIAESSLFDGKQSIAVWGDDALTPEIDGAVEGESIQLTLVDGLNVFSLVLEPFTYKTDGMIAITSSAIQNYECTGAIMGCLDASACNFSDVATENDGSCLYPTAPYDCDNQCLNDIDADGICDELEIVGCTDPMACNYLDIATDEGSCEYAGSDNCDVNVTEATATLFKLYPNPGKDQIYIQSTNEYRNLNITMMNILGAKAFDKTLQDVRSKDLIEINLPNLSKGIYIVTLYSASEVRSLKWVKE